MRPLASFSGLERAEQRRRQERERRESEGGEQAEAGAAAAGGGGGGGTGMWTDGDSDRRERERRIRTLPRARGESDAAGSRGEAGGGGEGLKEGEEEEEEEDDVELEVVEIRGEDGRVRRRNLQKRSRRRRRRRTDSDGGGGASDTSPRLRARGERFGPAAVVSPWTGTRVTVQARQLKGLRRRRTLWERVFRRGRHRSRRQGGTGNRGTWDHAPLGGSLVWSSCGRLACGIAAFVWHVLRMSLGATLMVWVVCVLIPHLVEYTRSGRERRLRRRLVRSNVQSAQRRLQEFSLRGATIAVRDSRVVRNNYALYKITVSCNGRRWDVWKRFSEVYDLRHALVRTITLEALLLAQQRGPPASHGVVDDEGVGEEDDAVAAAALSTLTPGQTLAPDAHFAGDTLGSRARSGSIGGNGNGSPRGHAAAAGGSSVSREEQRRLAELTSAALHRVLYPSSPHDYMALVQWLPTLPHKTIYRVLEESFLQERGDRLHDFLSVFFSHPYLCDHAEIRLFLGLPVLPGHRSNRIREVLFHRDALQRRRMQERVAQLAPANIVANLPTYYDHVKHWIAPWLNWNVDRSTRGEGGSGANSDGGGADGRGAGGGGEDGVAGDAAGKDMFDRTMHTFEFDDIHPGVRAIYEDCGPINMFRVRGMQYMADRKKYPAGPAMCRLMVVDLIRVDAGPRDDHVALLGRCRQRVETLSQLGDRPFIFLLNFQIPGDPPVSIIAYFAVPRDLLDRVPGPETEKFLCMLERYINVPGTPRVDLLPPTASNPDLPKPVPMCAAAGAPPHASPTARTQPTTSSSLSSSPSSSSGAGAVPQTPPRAANGRDGADGGVGGGMTMATTPSSRADLSDMATEARSEDGARYWVSNADTDPGTLPRDDFRNTRFKLIPSVREGPWVVKQAVGNKPALLGQKVTMRYFRGENYMEADVDVGSSIVADKVVGICRGYAKYLAVDIGVVLQGECEEELPERMLGCLTLKQIDLQYAQTSRPEDD